MKELIKVKGFQVLWTGLEPTASAALLDAAADGPVVACGLSIGGYVLLRALEREPARFRGLIVDTRSSADNDAGKLKRVEAMRTLRERGAAGYYAEAFV